MRILLIEDQKKLCDLMLPILSGADVLRSIRRGLGYELLESTES